MEKPSVVPGEKSEVRNTPKNGEEHLRRGTHSATSLGKRERGSKKTGLCLEGNPRQQKRGDVIRGKCS